MIIWSCPLCRGEELPRGVQRLGLCDAHFARFVRSTMLFGREPVPAGPIMPGVEERRTSLFVRSLRPA